MLRIFEHEEEKLTERLRKLHNNELRDFTGYRKLFGWWN